MKALEELGDDNKPFAERKVSSQPVIRQGKNRGARTPEVGGHWQYIDGYTYECGSDVKWAHKNWANKLLELGQRVGIMHRDGTVNYYVFLKDQYENG